MFLMCPFSVYRSSDRSGWGHVRPKADAPHAVFNKRRLPSDTSASQTKVQEGRGRLEEVVLGGLLRAV